MKIKRTTGWSAERRAAQSKRLKELKPWLKSTGPKTAAGKKRAAFNSYKHGLSSAQAKRLRAVLRRHSRMLKEVNAYIWANRPSQKLAKSQNELLNARPSPAGRGCPNTVRTGEGLLRHPFIPSPSHAAHGPLPLPEGEGSKLSKSQNELLEKARPKMSSSGSRLGVAATA